MADQSQSLNRNIPHPPTNPSPSIGISAPFLQTANMAEDALRTMAARRVELERVLTEAKLIGGTRRPMEEVTQLKVSKHE
eukprot:9486173-Pyramimonas_sp.AAC.1